MSNELTVIDDHKPIRECDIHNLDYTFDDKRAVAKNVATRLTNVIETQGLAIDIKGNQYVTAEGW